jgi:mono/diheme cytochrome c family protein
VAIVDLLPTADHANGRVRYEDAPGCWECHGIDGAGMGTYTGPLSERLPLLNDLALALVILEGTPPPGTDPGMPAYGLVEDLWDDQAIADVMAYVRSAFEP